MSRDNVYYLVIIERITNIFNKQEKYNQAAHYLQYIIPITDSSQQLQKINDVAFFYQKAKNYRKSLKFYKLGLKKSRLLPNKVYEALQQYKIGYYYISQQKIKQAKKQFKKSIAIFKNASDNSSADSYSTTAISNAAYFFYKNPQYKDIGIPIVTEFARVTQSSFDKQNYEALVDWLKKKK